MRYTCRLSAILLRLSFAVVLLACIATLCSDKLHNVTVPSILSLNPFSSSSARVATALSRSMVSSITPGATKMLLRPSAERGYAGFRSSSCPACVLLFSYFCDYQERRLRMAQDLSHICFRWVLLERTSAPTVRVPSRCQLYLIAQGLPAPGLTADWTVS